MGTSHAVLAILSTPVLLSPISAARSPIKFTLAPRAVIPLKGLDAGSRNSVVDEGESPGGRNCHQLRGGSDGNSVGGGGGRLGDGIVDANDDYYRDNASDGGQSFPGSSNGPYFPESGMPRPNIPETNDFGSDPMMMYGQREAVEDRLAAWRMAQQVCVATYSNFIT